MQRKESTMKVKSETIMILPDESLIKQFEDYYSSLHYLKIIGHF